MSPYDFHIEIIYSPYYNQLFNMHSWNPKISLAIGSSPWPSGRFSPGGDAAFHCLEKNLDSDHAVAPSIDLTTLSYSTTKYTIQLIYIYIYISLSQLSIESAELQIVSLGYPLPEGLVGNDCGTYHRSRFFRHRSPVKNAIRRQEQCTRYYNSLKLAFAEGHCNSARCAGEGHRDWWIGPIGGGWP